MVPRCILACVLLSQPCVGRRALHDVDASAAVNGTVESQSDNIIWRCESVPTFKQDSSSSCGGQLAACFNNKKGSNWACLGHGDNLERTCSASNAPDGTRYLGTCVYEGHALWFKALIFRVELLHWMVPPKGSKVPPKSAQPPAAKAPACSMERHTDYPGHDIRNIAGCVSPGECCRLCDEDSHCSHWSWGHHAAPTGVREVCWLKSNKGEVKTNGFVHSGKSSKKRSASKAPAPAQTGRNEFLDKDVYRCETVPTFKAGLGLSCGADNRQMAACFSTRRGTSWACLDGSVTYKCADSKDPKGRKYKGACVKKGHANWNSAKKFSNSAQPAPAQRTPARPVPAPHAAVALHKTASWKTTGKLMGRQGWCKAQRPHLTWTPSLCPKGPSIDVKVLNYNLFWWSLYGVRRGNSASASKLIAKTGPYDLMGFQECDDVARVIREIPGMSSRYGFLKGSHAVSMAYLKERWNLLAEGQKEVNQDQWGRRIVHWARLQHTSGKVVFFLNHHGPLGDAGYCGHEATSWLMLQQIGVHAHKDDAIIVVGDFNAVPHSKTVRYLEEHIKRIYTGNDFGGVDHFFSNCGKALEKKNLGKGGSDHDALSVKLRI